MRIKPKREFYIPKGARRVSHRHSSAVAYVYSKDGFVKALAFSGRRQKPDWHYRWRDDERGGAAREAQIRRYFAEVQEREEAIARVRNAPHELSVGSILRASWGYDQTNIDYYEVVGLIGAKMVELREIAQESKPDGGPGGGMTGYCVPLPGQYIGDPFRKRADGDGVKLASYKWARKVEPKMISGVPVYEGSRWTAYA